MGGWSVGNNSSYSGCGANWFAQTSGTVNHLYGIVFIGDSIGWVSGANGTILHTMNGGKLG